MTDAAGGNVAPGAVEVAPPVMRKLLGKVGRITFRAR
jgi:hypothetical protein